MLGCSWGPCERGGEGAVRRRSKRFTSDIHSNSDVPVVAGLAGLSLPTASPLIALRPKIAGDDDSNDVPVFKGSHDGTPLIRVVTPAPRGAPRAALRPGITTPPSVPVVKGSPDPAHPTTHHPDLSPALPGDLQLTPEEQEALAVLLEGRHHKAPTSNPRRPAMRPTTPRPSTVTRISSKVRSQVIIFYYKRPTCDSLKRTITSFFFRSVERPRRQRWHWTTSRRTEAAVAAITVIRTAAARGSCCRSWSDSWRFSGN